MSRTGDQTASIHTADVRFPLAEGITRRAALARPQAGDRARPAVIVLHEILGLNDDIRRIARRFAESGYVALAPDLFEGAGPRPICIVRAMRDLNRGRGRAFDEIEAARAWLAERPDVDGGRIGVAGFCMGGGFAILYARRAPVGAAATFYGQAPQRADTLAGICPVAGGYGARDRVFAPQGDRLRRLLDELGVEHDIVTYPHCGHSYMNQHSGWIAWLGRMGPMRVGYDESAAEDSWRRMLSFFARHLGSTGRDDRA